MKGEVTIQREDTGTPRGLKGSTLRFGGKTFSGFEFKAPQGEALRVIDCEPPEGIFDPARNRKFVVLDLSSSGPIPEAETEKWDREGIEQELRSLMERIDRRLGYPLLTEKRIEFMFVPRSEMKPKTEEGKQWLREQYGEYILDTSVGDCRRNADGSFTIRIGYAGEEETTEKESVLWTGLHEIGHTLGDNLDDSVDEELKANAFAHLGMKEYKSGGFWEIPSMPEVDKVHDNSLHRLKLLLEAEITEEEIIAHLTGTHFGQAQSNDYLSHIGTPQ